MRMPCRHRPSSRRAVVLVMVLWIVVVLSVVFYSLMEELTLDTKLTGLRKRDMQAYCAARAGVARAVADLSNDVIVDISRDSQQYDSLGDVWAQDDQLVDVDYAKAGGQLADHVSYTVLVEDEESKINLNMASYELIEALLRVLGQKDDKAKDIAEAIWDWRDPDTRPKSGQGEYENAYYAEKQMKDEHARIRNGNYVYISKNDAFTTLEELLDVYGVTPELYYGHDARARHESRSRRPSARQRVKRPDGSAMGERKGLRDFLTLSSNGTVNVNTAPAEALAAIALAEGKDISEAMALAQTACGERGGKKANSSAAFRSLQDFYVTTKFPTPRRSRVGLDVRSVTFTLTALGQARGLREARGVEHSVQAVVRRDIDYFPLNPAVGDIGGVWSPAKDGPPYYKKVRVDFRQPAMTYEPSVHVILWVDW